MGRYDALTELDEKKPLGEKAPKPESKQTGKPTSTQVDKPTNGSVSKPTSEVLPQPSNEKPQKYTTHLHPDMVKKIKLLAVQQDIKDYEVVETALTEYFEKNKVLLPQ
jgi:hypothetical protein